MCVCVYVCMCEEVRIVLKATKKRASIRGDLTVYGVDRMRVYSANIFTRSFPRVND